MMIIYSLLYKCARHFSCYLILSSQQLCEALFFYTRFTDAGTLMEKGELTFPGQLALPCSRGLPLLPCTYFPFHLTFIMCYLKVLQLGLLVFMVFKHSSQLVYLPQTTFTHLFRAQRITVLGEPVSCKRTVGFRTCSHQGSTELGQQPLGHAAQCP